MKILFLTEKFPLPLDTGGNVRTFHLLCGLAARYDVTLLSTDSGGVSHEDRERIASICRAVHVIKVPAESPLRDAMALSRCIVSRDSFIVRRHFFHAFARKVRQLCEEEMATGKGFDVVHFNHLDTAPYCPYIPARVARVLDQHNVISNLVRSMLDTETNPVRQWILKREQRVIDAAERHLCSRMDRVLVCSADDERSLRGIGVKTPMQVVPNGVDLDYFSVTAPTQFAAELVFLGTMDYEPCERGVWYFCTEILPLLKSRLPQCRLTVVGKNPSERLLNLAREDGNVIFTGRVPDVRPLVQGAAVFIVPILSGSGTRLKILEAMAMGVPVVSTPIGAEGIDVRDGEDILLAATPQSFADAVLKLLGSAELRASLIRGGRKLVERQYGWPRIQRVLCEQYDEIVRETTRSNLRLHARGGALRALPSED